jgi:hypothetical protein
MFAPYLWSLYVFYFTVLWRKAQLIGPRKKEAR